MSEKIFEVAAWGKYIYRSDIERHHYEYKIQNDESGIRFYIYIVVNGLHHYTWLSKDGLV